MRANRVTACFVAAFLACGGGACALAAPAIPVSIDWFAAGTAPGLDVYRSGPITLDVTIKTNGAPYNLTGSTPVGWWATSNTASAVVTGTVTVLSATAGTFRVAFSGSDMNYTAGRYIYGIGLTSGSYTTARQGTMLIRADPYATGALPVTWTSNLNWGVYQFLSGGSGPAIGDGSTITWTTNAVGQVVMTAISSGDITAVTAGAYLSGGGASGAVSLAVTGLTDVATFNAHTNTLGAGAFIGRHDTNGYLTSLGDAALKSDYNEFSTSNKFTGDVYLSTLYNNYGQQWASIDEAGAWAVYDLAGNTLLSGSSWGFQLNRQNSDKAIDVRNSYLDAGGDYPVLYWAGGNAGKIYDAVGHAPELSIDWVNKQLWSDGVMILNWDAANVVQVCDPLLGDTLLSIGADTAQAGRLLTTTNYGPWTTSGTATNGEQIVNYQTLTNLIANPPGHVMFPMGECAYFSLTGTNVAIAAATTDGITNMIQVSCDSAIAANSTEFDNGGADDGTLRYTGSVTRDFHVAMTVSFAGQGAGDTLVFAIAKNGTIAGASRILNRVQNVNDKQSTAIQVYLELATNDELTVWAGNLSDADDVTVHSVNFFAMGM